MGAERPLLSGHAACFVGGDDDGGLAAGHEVGHAGSYSIDSFSYLPFGGAPCSLTQDLLHCDDALPNVTGAGLVQPDRASAPVR